VKAYKAKQKRRASSSPRMARRPKMLEVQAGEKARSARPDKKKKGKWQQQYSSNKLQQ